MSNLYVRVMTGFYTHRKTVKLKIKLGSDAYWIPPRLWAYAAENQADGNLSAYSSEELAELLGCPSYAKVMLQALKDSGFVDESGMIHDWADHNGYHDRFSERAKKAAAARWSKKSPTPPKDTGKGTVDSGDKHCISDATSIIQHLNLKTGRNFRETESNLKFIKSRLSEKDVTVDGIKKMIDRQCERWIGTDQAEYLRPETLFNKTKFDSYYASKDLPYEPNKRNGEVRIDRSIGTANEGTADQYKGLGRLVKNPDAQRP
jgi:uncharacterized phage protein (TIGR02220 family)